jgi:hypothetical protein
MIILVYFLTNASGLEEGWEIIVGLFIYILLVKINVEKLPP